MSFYRFVQVVVKNFLRFRYHYTIVNADKLPLTGGIILAANHHTYGDPLFIGLGFKRKVSFMAKEELFRVPVVGFIVKRLGAFPVSRGAGDHGAIDKAVAVVRSGGVLGIFPEGTRSKDGRLGRVKSGAIVVAARTGGDILPVGITYGNKRMIRQELRIEYGDVIKNKTLGLDGELGKNELKRAAVLLSERINGLLYYPEKGDTK